MLIVPNRKIKPYGSHSKDQNWWPIEDYNLLLVSDAWFPRANTWRVLKAAWDYKLRRMFGRFGLKGI